MTVDKVERGGPRGDKECAAMPLMEMMTKAFKTVAPEISVRKAAELMKERQIRRVIVLNEEGKLVGIVSLGDLATTYDDAGVGGAVLEKASEPLEPTRPGIKA
jgi:CBS domain-containing protein